MTKRKRVFTRRQQRALEQWARENPGDALVVGAAAVATAIGGLNLLPGIIKRARARVEAASAAS